jgi:DNA-binding CsgD family transcriptional regulator
MRTASRARDIVGRGTELVELERFLDGGSGARALLLTGGPGIGKTTLWEAGADAALARDAVVLAARPSEAEARLSHAALGDLLADIDADVLAALPAPQREALEVALLRAKPVGRPRPYAVAAGLLRTLRELAARSSVVVAVDDLQWLDRSSANALSFAARRLQADAVAFLLTERAGGSSVTAALEPAVQRLEVGALSLGATRRLLRERLGFAPSRHALRQIHTSTRGNPLFILEVGRMLAEREGVESDDEIPVPGRVEDLLGVRVERLPRSVRKALLAVALSGDPRLAQLEAVGGRANVDAGLDAGLLVLEGERVRAAHPLVAAAARARSRASERRKMHLALAVEMEEPELRARHLALATTAPNGDLAATLSEATAMAAARGAADGALELARHALRLTPPRAEQRADRVLALAELMGITGDPQSVDELLAAEQANLPSGTPQARAHILLGLSRWSTSHVDEFDHHLDRALEESAGDPALHAAVIAMRVRHHALGRVERVREAESWALEELPAARAAGPAAERDVLQILAWVRVVRGEPIEDLRHRFESVSPDAFHILRSPERAAAERSALRGDLSRARALLEDLLRRSDERGEMDSYAIVRLQLCELELRAGSWDRAQGWLEEGEQSPDGQLLEEAAYERCRAVLAAGLGRADEAERWAEQALAVSEARGGVWSILESHRALGLGALLAHDAERAAQSLRIVWKHTEREGVDEPAIFPVAPDLVEALVELGKIEEAQAVIDRLQRLAEDQEHPWGLATAKRCRGLVQLACAAEPSQAATELEAAAVAYAERGLRFDHGRTLLILGRAARRLRKWGIARSALERAAAVFDEIGSIGWAKEARSELDRVGGRKPRPSGELTPTERRVLELAADGLSNKEIAQQLFVSVNTVETHLSHAYSKLGVRSRTQLARALKRSRISAI